MAVNDYTIEIERALLSAILYEPSCFEEILARLDASDFLQKSHQHIFTALVALYQEDEPLDEGFILKKSSSKCPIDREELLSILGTNPIIEVSSYVEEIKNRSIKRKLGRLAVLIKDQSQQDDLDSGQILDTIEQEIYKFSQERIQHDFRESEEIVTQTLELMRTIKERGNSIVTGLDTGFKELNKSTAGFGQGDLVIIAARPSMGKTAFALNIALKVLGQGKGVAIFSLEMAAEQLMLRMLSMQTSIPLQDLRIGNMNDAELQNLSDASDMMSRMPLFVDDGGMLSIAHLRTKMRKLKSRRPDVELVIVDYLQLMTGGGKKDRHLEVSEISRGLKMLARELQIPVIALSQLNRALETRSDKRPMLSDLRESGSIEQDADLILFIYRDDVYKQKAEKEKEEQAKKDNKDYKSTFVLKEEEKAEIIIGKQRNGPTGTVELIFHKAFSRFADYQSEITISYEESKPTILQTPSDHVELPNI